MLIKLFHCKFLQLDNEILKKNFKQIIKVCLNSMAKRNNFLNANT